MQRSPFQSSLPIFLFPLLALALSADAEEIGKPMRIGDYPAIALMGPAQLDEDVAYVSFSGDFGIKKTKNPWDPIDELLDRHLALESPLLQNFQLNVVNMEELLHGHLGSEIDLRQDAAALHVLVGEGFDLVSLANNHAWDYGNEGVDLTIESLDRNSIAVIGSREHPVFRWELEGQTIAIFSATHYTDAEDESGRILTLSDEDLATIGSAIGDAEIRIAFIHLGSISAFPSPHEFRLVQRVADAGADLIICTGNHLVKGFAIQNDRPVHFGIGNHIMSWKGENTEPVGSHLVAGFKDGELVQLITIPFLGDITEGRLGPLSDSEFAAFTETLTHRSDFAEGNYFSDSLSRDLLFDQLGFLTPARLLKLRPRHIAYGLNILRAHYPIRFWAAVILGIGATYLLSRWLWQQVSDRQARS